MDTQDRQMTTNRRIKRRLVQAGELAHTNSDFVSKLRYFPFVCEMTNKLHGYKRNYKSCSAWIDKRRR